MPKNTRTIKKIFVHCSASDDSLDLGVREIKKLHTSPKTELVEWNGKKIPGRGWTDVGYHYIIRRNGVIERGRADWISGAHVKGHNKTSLGVVWVGLKEPSQDQYRSLLALLRGLMNQYNVDIENVLGHCEINHLKTCPNLNMMILRGNLLFTGSKDISEQIKEVIKL